MNPVERRDIEGRLGAGSPDRQSDHRDSVSGGSGGDHYAAVSHAFGTTLSQIRMLRWRYAATFACGFLLAVSAWQANRGVCPQCTVSDVWLRLGDGTPIYSRLYVPDKRDGDGSALPASGQRLPAVVVCHGYLANLAFMETPWAADLTQLGLAVLFLDRRGHGRSGGTLWPRAQPSRRLTELEPDVAAALAYLRARSDVINPARIALFGHSDGATAAVIAASADWNVRATVAVSASVAPWQFVNHVAPQDLLLVYGADDQFVLHDTDGALIARGTRGLLDGPGEFGDIDDGSARRLVRIPGYGHIAVLFSDEARRQTLEWLRLSLVQEFRPSAVRSLARRSGTQNRVPSSPAAGALGSRHHWTWVWIGLAAILVALRLSARSQAQRFHTARPLRSPIREGQRERPKGAQRPNSAPQEGAPLCSHEDRARVVPGRAWLQAATLTLAWVAGLLVAPWLAKHGQSLVPGQEGAVFADVLLGPTISLGVLGLARLLLTRAGASTPMRVKRAAPIVERATHTLVDVVCGACSAAALFAAVHVLLLHHYEVWLTLPRVPLLLLVTACALPLFVAVEWCLGQGTRWYPSGCLVSIAVATASLSGQLFERMSMVPGYLLAATLVFFAMHRAVENSGRPGQVRSTVFAALTTGWLGGVVCALY